MYLDILMECYISLTSPFDHADEKLEQLPLQDHPYRQSRQARSNAAEEAKPVMAIMEKCTQNRQGFADFFYENGVLTEDDIQQWQDCVDGVSVLSKSVTLRITSVQRFVSKSSRNWPFPFLERQSADKASSLTPTLPEDRRTNDIVHHTAIFDTLRLRRKRK